MVQKLIIRPPENKLGQKYPTQDRRPSSKPASRRSEQPSDPRQSVLLQCCRRAAVKGAADHCLFAAPVAPLLPADGRRTSGNARGARVEASPGGFSTFPFARGWGRSKRCGKGEALPPHPQPRMKNRICNFVRHLVDCCQHLVPGFWGLGRCAIQLPDSICQLEPKRPPVCGMLPVESRPPPLRSSISSFAREVALPESPALRNRSNHSVQNSLH